MAFTWDVEVLRKILDTILEGGEAQERYDFGKDLLEKSKKGQAKKSDAAIRDEKIAREQFELGPDDPLPAHWEVDSDGLAWDLTPFDRQEEQREEARYPHGRPTADPDDPRNYEHVWPTVEELLSTRSGLTSRQIEAAKTKPSTGAREAFERAAELERTLNLPFRGFEDTYTGDSPDWYLSDEELEVAVKGNKLKLDWVNEILKEFQEDKAPEVLRLPHEKDEKDMSPFLSYMLSQSPYARLPAAGLLGIGSMLYSNPAY